MLSNGSVARLVGVAQTGPTPTQYAPGETAFWPPRVDTARYCDDPFRGEKFARVFNGRVNSTDANTLGLDRQCYTHPFANYQRDLMLAAK